MQDVHTLHLGSTCPCGCLNLGLPHPACIQTFFHRKCQSSELLTLVSIHSRCFVKLYQISRCSIARVTIILCLFSEIEHIFTRKLKRWPILIKFCLRLTMICLPLALSGIQSCKAHRIFKYFLS